MVLASRKFCCPVHLLSQSARCCEKNCSELQYEKVVYICVSRFHFFCSAVYLAHHHLTHPRALFLYTFFFRGMGPPMCHFTIQTKQKDSSVFAILYCFTCILHFSMKQKFQNGPYCFFHTYYIQTSHNLGFAYDGATTIHTN